MRTQILKLLAAQPGTFVSGESLIKATGISRQGVWKHIQALIDEGYQITSAKGQGYCLEASPTDLTQTQLETIVGVNGLLDKALHFETIGSTNAYLKEHSRKLTTALVVSDEQTAGRGRLGRNWESAAGDGLWMSMLLRPPIQPAKASMLTQVVAVSMVKALQCFEDVRVSIKWPNDLWIGETKLCGILTEMAAEINAIEYVVVGIGVNLKQQSFPEPISGVATSLVKHTQMPISRAQIVARFLDYFKEDYQQFIADGDLSGFVPFLNENAYLNGHQVWLSDRPDGNYKALGVNALGELQVQDPEGNIVGLSYGEVSVRRKDYAIGI